MRYTVFEHGRPIGETDLAFARTAPCARFGWFFPNELGETLMPIVGAVLPAVSALKRVERGTGTGAAATDAEVRQTSEFADWSEAMHRLAQLDLELRRADGTVVPTEQICLQDTEALHAFAAEEDETSPLLPWDDDLDVMHLDDMTDEDAELAAEIEADLATLAEWDRESELAGSTSLDEGEPEMGRYQIFVLLLDEDAIP